MASSIACRISEKAMIIDGLTVPKGTFFYLSFISLHNSELYWQHPQVFDPNRWLGGHKTHVGLAGIPGDERCDDLQVQVLLEK